MNEKQLINVDFEIDFTCECGYKFIVFDGFCGDSGYPVVRVCDCGRIWEFNVTAQTYDEWD